MEADLGIDSIKRVEILGALRERYPQAAMVGPEQMAELRTLADVVALISPVVGVPTLAPEDPVAPPTVRTDAFGVLRRHPQLCPLPAVDRRPGVYAADPVAILVDDGSALCQSLASGLSALGWEIAVLRLLAAGSSNKEIAARLKISENTAANHVRSILLKTGAANRTQVAMLAVSRGWIADPVSARAR